MQSTEDESLLNLTPLIDVVFVVLILFILIAPMLETDRIQLASGAPKEKTQPITQPEAGPLAIYVHKDNSIWVRSKKVTSDQLLLLLKQEKNTRPHQTPQLFQDKKAEFGLYQTVKNAVEMAGFEELDVILEPG
jgi:biopolymer transport protein ExbD